MGMLVEYFAARSDQAAAATIGAGPGAAGIEVLDEWTIDPTVQLANLEEALTGRDWAQVAADGDGIVASQDGGEQLVFRLSDPLMTALIDAGPGRLAQVAESWARAEEFYGQGDPDMLLEFLTALHGLAAQAWSRDDQVYCWACV